MCGSLVAEVETDDIVAGCLQIEVSAALGEVAFSAAPVDCPVVVGAELELTCVEVRAGFPALQVLVVGHFHVGIPAAAYRADNTDGFDGCELVGQLLQIDLDEVEAGLYGIHVRTAVLLQCSGGGIAGCLLVVVVPVVLVGLELELAVEVDDSIVIALSVAVQRVRLAPAALVADLVDELVEADGRYLVGLVEHVELDAIVEGLVIGRSDAERKGHLVVLADDKASFSIRLTVRGSTDHVAAPEAFSAGISAGRGNLEPVIDAVAVLTLRGGDSDGEHGIVIHVAAAVLQFVGLVAVAPTVRCAHIVVSFLDDGSLRDGFDDEGSRGGRLDGGASVADPHTYGRGNLACRRTTAVSAGDDFLQFGCRHLTFGVEGVGFLADVERVVGFVAFGGSRGGHDRGYLDQRLVFGQCVKVDGGYGGHATVAERHRGGLGGLLLRNPVLIIFGAGGQPEKGCRCDEQYLFHNSYSSEGLAIKKY